MRKYLDYLFNKNLIFDESILSNSLFISIDKLSALRGDYKLVVDAIKIYDSYEVIKEDIRVLQEGYEQGHYIIKVNDKLLFIRLILSDKLIYDVLIYTINDIDFINKVFFSRKEIKAPKEFEEYLLSNKLVLILYQEDNSDYRIIKANNYFYSCIKYEDWDFNNKYQNVLNQIQVDEIDLYNLRLYRSDKNIVNLECEVINKDRFFLLTAK